MMLNMLSTVQTICKKKVHKWFFAGIFFADKCCVLIVYTKTSLPHPGNYYVVVVLVVCVLCENSYLFRNKWLLGYL